MRDLTDVALEWEPVTTAEQLEQVRTWRNAARWYLFDQRWISEDAQLAWWEHLQESGDLLWIVRDATGPAGFCLLAKRPDVPPVRTWITLVVAEPARNRGIGTRIYSEAPVRAGGEVWAAIRRSNVASMRAAEAADYVLSADTGNIAIYRSGTR